MEQEKVNKRVKVHSLLSVVSGNPIEPGQTHDLSWMDRVMGHHTIHIVFYYGSNPFVDGPMSSDLDNLRISLSRLLDEYPVVTGRLTRGPGGGWRVKCNDAGVRMLQASVSTTLDEWLRSADPSEERDLTVWEEMPQDPSFWSPFRIQLSYFKCGGLAIGLSCTHMGADITSATLLIKSWAEEHCGQPLTQSPTFHLPKPPTMPSQNNYIPPFAASNYTNNNTWTRKMSTATMKFSSRIIERCISEVRNHCPDITPFDVLVALFWSRIAHWQEPVPGDDGKRSLLVCLDARDVKGDPEIPKGYFGNALHFSRIDVDAGDLCGGLGQVSNSIHRHVAGLKGDEFWSCTSWLEEHGEKEDVPFRIYGHQLTCISVEHTVNAENGVGLMYAAAFKKGQWPVHVSCRLGNVEGEGLIMVMPSPEGGLGRTVAVMLPEEQIAKLCKDQDILDLEPCLLISGKR